MSNHVDFTVAVPTYNGANRLPKLLEILGSQIHTENLTWEIIIVDNNSTDNTAAVVQRYQDSGQYKYPLIKYAFEARQGAAYARKRAVKEAKGELIGFLDDDNYPNTNWVAKAYDFAQKYPQAGAYGSQIHPDWEVEPPENFMRLAPFLAITERGNLPLKYEPKKKLLPPSAGLVIRRQAWLESMPDKMILTGRTSGKMLTGEDLEMLSYIQSKGWEIWYNPEMEIYHKIPHWRLQKEYLIPFFRGIGLSRYVTRIATLKTWTTPFILLAYFINDLRKIFILILKSLINMKYDLVIACEIQLVFSSLISPFYLALNGYFKKNNS